LGGYLRRDFTNGVGVRERLRYVFNTFNDQVRFLLGTYRVRLIGIRRFAILYLRNNKLKRQKYKTIINFMTLIYVCMYIDVQNVKFLIIITDTYIFSVFS